MSNRYAIEATHTYTGVSGAIYTAKLTVENTTTGESTTGLYYVAIRDKSLPVEVNVAIDEGLWNLHTTQIRSGSEGYWSGERAKTPVNINAFEVNGHLGSGSSQNPYVETVARGMQRTLNDLRTTAIGPQGLGNPDTNGNGFSVRTNSGRQFYEGGIYMDAIIASGTPTATATTGVAGVVGRTYKDIIQDMVDHYAYGQYDAGAGPYPVVGGWRYSANQFPDNSACQWAAIGMIPAERNWGCVVPPWVKTANVDWLRYSQRADGVYGYTSAAPLSGVPYGTTPAGMVQCAFDGLGRGNPLWDKAETFLRDNWNPFKPYFYGTFSFVKSMLLHDSNGDGVAEPIKLLQSSSPGVPPLDWYGAEVSNGDPLDGLARYLVDDQNANGTWSGNGWFDTQGLTTAWCIIMLNRTIVESGVPVAVAKAFPNPAVAGQTITLDGTDSFHQDSARSIVLWEWDLDDDGVFDVTGPFASVSFPAVGNYPVTLRVTGDGGSALTDEDILTVLVNPPPVAPTADAGSSYVFCPDATWFLDGLGTRNPDEGESEPGAPGDTIQSYEWELDGDNDFNDAFGATPDVTAFFEGLGAGTYLIQLRVTDTTATSFPSSGFGDLQDTDSAVVIVAEEGDAICVCVDDLSARPKSGKVQLVWSDTAADHYNIYRSEVAGGPYLYLDTTFSDYSTYLDSTVANGTTYYYVVRPADILDDELCQSNEATVTPTATRARGRR